MVSICISFIFMSKCVIDFQLAGGVLGKGTVRSTTALCLKAMLNRKMGMFVLFEEGRPLGC